MKITLLANRDLASIIAINHLLQYAGHHQYSVLLSAKVGGSQPKPEALINLAFFEQSLFNDIIFPAIALTALQHRQFKTFDDLPKLAIPVAEITNINSDQAIQTLCQENPDLILSIRFGQILKAPVIAVPKFGVLNLHSGRLPDYRGVMATFWAMLNKQTSISTTLHFIQDAQIDAGDIVAIDTQPVEYQKSYLWNLISLYKQGVSSMADAIAAIEKGQKPEQKQSDITTGSYYSFPTQTQLDQFHQAGSKLFDVDEIKEFAQLFMPETTLKN